MIKKAVLLFVFSFIAYTNVEAVNKQPKTPAKEKLSLEKASNESNTESTSAEIPVYQTNVPLLYLVNFETQQQIKVFSIQSNKFYLPTNPTFEVK